MEILNNLSTNNHKLRIGKLFGQSEKIVIASPFLMPRFDDFLNSISIKANSEIEIITTLQPNSIEQIRKVDSLLSLMKHPQIVEKNIRVTISINNKLHGKIYSFKGDKIDNIIISSANFTQNGLTNNHEWGIEIAKKSTVETIRKELKQSLQKSGITLIELENMKEACDKFKEKNEVPNQKIELNLVSLIPTDISTDEFPKNITFWIKPIGVTEDPIPVGRKFERLEQKLNFSTNKKPNVKIGDVLICYGVGAKQILSIYRVEELPEYETKEEIEKEPWLERWAWYVVGKNLTPNFGGEWWTHNLNAFELVKEFKEFNSDIPITKSGGDTLGGLNYGHDKLRLKREFAEFIIKKVIEINRK